MLMDDANVPNLLSLPYLGYVPIDSTPSFRFFFSNGRYNLSEYP